MLNGNFWAKVGANNKKKPHQSHLVRRHKGE
jgi:hypothetical protein